MTKSTSKENTILLNLGRHKLDKAEPIQPSFWTEYWVKVGFRGGGIDFRFDRESPLYVLISNPEETLVMPFSSDELRDSVVDCYRGKDKIRVMDYSPRDFGDLVGKAFGGKYLEPICIVQGQGFDRLRFVDTKSKTLLQFASLQGRLIAIEYQKRDERKKVFVAPGRDPSHKHINLVIEAQNAMLEQDELFKRVAEDLERELAPFGYEIPREPIYLEKVDGEISNLSGYIPRTNPRITRK
jgi:hypothetical protein